MFIFARETFVRRGYFAAGPNQVWHVDGYDKLKPFGIAISGCIDGFSRKVMWLCSGSSNNDPRIIAHYYMQCVSDFGLPARLRTDCGTENGTMVAIHCALRAEHADDFACMALQLQINVLKVGGPFLESKGTGILRSVINVFFKELG